MIGIGWLIDHLPGWVIVMTDWMTTDWRLTSISQFSQNKWVDWLTDWLSELTHSLTHWVSQWLTQCRNEINDWLTNSLSNSHTCSLTHCDWLWQALTGCDWLWLWLTVTVRMTEKVYEWLTDLSTKQWTNGQRNTKNQLWWDILAAVGPSLWRMG